MESWLLLQIQISIVILVALILRQFMRGLPKIYSYTLWLVVFIRLLCPWSIESPVSLIPSEEHLETFLGWNNDNAVPQYSRENASPQISPSLQSYLQNADTNPMAAPDSEGNVFPENTLPDDMKSSKPESDPKQDATGILSSIYTVFLSKLSSENSSAQKILILVWLAGLLSIWIYNLSSLHRIRRNLKDAVLLEENVWTSSAIETPFVLGWHKPRIYLPCSLQDRERDYVLCHEKTHIRRKDYWIKNITFLLTTVYWYHPLVWLAFYFLGQDMEMSCDEAVMRQLGTDIKKQYSQSLLNFAAGSRMSSATPLAFGEIGVKQRIKNVLSYKNTKRWIGLIGIFLVVTAGAVLLTTREISGSPMDNSEEPKDMTEDISEGTPGDIPGATLGEDQEGTEILQSSSENSSNEMEEILKEYTSPDGRTYQVRETGIFEVNSSEITQIYTGYIGTSPKLTFYEGRLFFMTNVTDAGKENYFYNGIGWVNPDNGEHGILNLRHNIITDFLVYYGYIWCDQQGTIPKHDIFILSDDEEQLPQAEAQQKGLELSRQLTENPGTLLEVGYHTPEQITAWLDLDMDGTVEEITIMRDPSVDKKYGYVPLDYYVLSAGAEQLTGFAYNMHAGIYAVSLDGETIQLVLYEHGPSADPVSHIIRYQPGQLAEAGTIEDDIRLREITAEGEIISHIFNYGIQDDYRVVSWRLDKSKGLVEIPQDTYELASQNEITLLVDLPVRSMPVPDEGVYSGIKGYVIEPQTVRLTAVSSDGSWLQLETEDGQQGWFQIEPASPPMWGYTVIELDMSAIDVFEGLIFLAG